MLNKEKKHWVRLTKTCNNRCVFCLDAKAQDNKPISWPEISEKIKSGFVPQAGFKQRLILSGGEPTLSPYFLQAIVWGKKMGFDKIQTITNGRMFCYKDFITRAKLAGLDEITFSLHSHLPSLHDQLTGTKGAYKQAITGLQNALPLGFIVNIDMVVNKKNYKSLLASLKFFHKLGVNEFDLLAIMPYGRAWDLGYGRLNFPLKNLLSLMAQIIDYAEKNNIVLWFNRFPLNFFEGREYLIKDFEKKLASEIFGERKAALKNFLAKNKELPCLNSAKCRYCFLENFCRQLFHFNKEIRNKKDCLEIFSRPFCLSKANYKKISLKPLIVKGKLSLAKFFDFFIKHLNRAQSLRCQKCRYKNKCFGLDLATIKAKGFKILKPIK